MSIRVIVLLGRFQHIQSILIVVIISDSILELFKISIKLITDFFKMFLSSNCLGFSLITYCLRHEHLKQDIGLNFNSVLG